MSGLGWRRHLLKNMSVRWWMKFKIGGMFREVCRYGIGVRLG